MAFSTGLTSAFAQESMNSTSEINDITTELDKINITITNLRSNIEFQDENTQIKLLVISNNLSELQQNIKINELNIDKIKNDIENINSQLNELKIIKSECSDKNFDCERLVQE